MRGKTNPDWNSPERSSHLSIPFSHVVLLDLFFGFQAQAAKFFEFFVPLFQVMLACGATYLVKTSIEKKPSN